MWPAINTLKGQQPCWRLCPLPSLDFFVPFAVLVTWYYQFRCGTGSPWLLVDKCTVTLILLILQLSEIYATFLV